jgi:hypothetical protein
MFAVQGMSTPVVVVGIHAALSALNIALLGDNDSNPGSTPLLHVYVVPSRSCQEAPLQSITGNPRASPAKTRFQLYVIGSAQRTSYHQHQGPRIGLSPRKTSNQGIVQVIMP